ncbi:MAG: NTP transferase domain-containing protein [Dehalococcoidia bacterium]|nr:NTP transferase domain-containing protein [Dehalococcoidia bacterium]MCB9486470.1 NTP transferase domain-containing protein [Thermoflexaceae bacterium]
MEQRDPGAIAPRAVILAAGRGSRLGDRTNGTPKPLVQLNGRPIVSYTLEALASAGVGDVVVVTGYEEAAVRSALLASRPDGMQMSFVHNARYREGASLSLRAARRATAGEPFLLLMCDHVVSAAFLAQFLLGCPEDVSAVAADFERRDPAYVAEATHLALDGRGRVTAIGKGIEPFAALDAGVFLLRESAWGAVEAASENTDLSTIFTLLAKGEGLHPVDISGQFWYDVDTEDDLVAAELLLNG